MLSIREMNYGHALYGECPDLQPTFDVLGQGNGIKICAQWVSRLAHSTGDINADISLYPIMHAANLVSLANKVANEHEFPAHLAEDKTADLVAYLIERGLGLIERGGV